MTYRAKTELLFVGSCPKIREHPAVINSRDRRPNVPTLKQTKVSLRSTFAA